MTATTIKSFCMARGKDGKAPGGESVDGKPEKDRGIFY